MKTGLVAVIVAVLGMMAAGAAAPRGCRGARWMSAGKR